MPLDSSEFRSPEPQVAAIPPAATPPAPRRSRRRLAIVALAALLIAGLGGSYGYHWWTVGRFIVSTDDAYVGAKNATLAAKVPGYIATLAVEDNAEVHTGDVIATLDDGDYRLAVQSAQDEAATERATIDRLGKQVLAQQAALDQAKAQLLSAKASATRAELELAR